MSRPRRVVIPTVYRAECPTLRSRLLPLCRQLAPRGYSFDFLVLGEGREEPEPGIFYTGYRNYPELVRRLVALRREGTEILFPCKPYSITGLLSLVVARVRGLGYLLDVDDRTFPSEINKWWRLPLYLQEWLSERLLMLLKPPTTVASRALADYWGEHAVYIPNSADPELFSRGRWNSGYIASRHGIKGPVVVWPAVFFQETDRAYALEIFAALQEMGEGATLLVIGTGDYLPEIKGRAAAMGLENVVFTGAVPYDQMPNYYASASAGFLPLRDNHYDACKGPIKLFEYMAMELPVIATDVGEPREMVNRAGCGIVIPFRDPQRAASLIARLLNSPELLKECGARGRSYLTGRQSFAAQAERLQQMLEKALSMQRRR